MVSYVVGLQTILVGTIEKERPSGRTISIGADTLDLEDISAPRAEIDEASGHGLEKITHYMLKKYILKITMEKVNYG